MDTEWQEVARAVDPGAELRRVRELQGGTSARVAALELSRPDGSLLSVLVRLYGVADQAAQPDAAHREFYLLEELHAGGVPVPRPLFADSAGAVCGRPLLVEEYVEGEGMPDPQEARDCLRQLAEALASLHELPTTLDVPLESAQARVARALAVVPPALDEAFSEGTLRRTLERHWPPPARNRPTLLHGDFWPGNTIWRGRQLAAVIDWEDACLGDPLSDLGNMRCELAMAFGAAAAEVFTAAYLRRRQEADTAALALWDLASALRPAGKAAGWGLPSARLRRCAQQTTASSRPRFVAWKASRLLQLLCISRSRTLPSRSEVGGRGALFAFSRMDGSRLRACPLGRAL